ncbi:Uma2 family endonuclease [Raineya orbicola]|jgi:Uma2 family endonuclease|uniref:Putative restriction endonuclease n=1 Tax=Raineya orbicola TaxID=2016530 RepID=A0A2N3IK09_9BACT|nr:Uma2 family endonuclease [Raineya orbicola]PKQ70588.1 putative restriction endonuclease [Raineya orbicola]
METLVKISVEEYLEQEARNQHKSEYHAGEVIAMAGASLKHNVIVANVITILSNCTKEKNCIVLPSDILVKLSTCERYVYPDVVLVCGEQHLEIYKGIEVLLNPTIIIEVLSESTAHYDAHEKMECYFALESLKEYWLVDSEKVAIRGYKRQNENDWNLHLTKNPEEKIFIGECEILVKDIYLKTNLL